MEENHTMQPAGLPEQPVAPEQPKSSKKAGIVALVILIVIAAAGWFAYKAYASPERVWQKYIESGQITQGQFSETVNFSYQDNGTVPDSLKANPGFAFLSGLKLSFSGTGYTDSTDIAHPQSMADINYSFGSGNTSFSSTAKLVIKDKDIYVNLGTNPFVSSALSMIAPGENVEWIKINGEEIAKASGATTTPDYAQQTAKYMEVLHKHMPKLVEMDKYIDRQTIRGVHTLHYSNKINKDELKSFMTDMVAAIFDQVKETGGINDQDLAKAKDASGKIINAMVDKFEPQTAETWIGMTDHKLHKIKFVSNAPSLVSFVAAASDPAVQNETDESKALDSVLSKISFDGHVTLDEELYDFGKTQEVKAPDNALDLAQKIGEEKKKSEQMMQQFEPVQ